jgi:hypothetical protein
MPVDISCMAYASKYLVFHFYLVSTTLHPVNRNAYASKKISIFIKIQAPSGHESQLPSPLNLHFILLHFFTILSVGLHAQYDIQSGTTELEKSNQNDSRR